MARAGWKKFRRLFWLSVLGIVVVAAVAVTFYVMYLDRIVTKQFEGRRWTLPAQVYAAPLELYASLPLNGSDLEHELQRLQYRRVDKLEHPGTYRLQGTRLDIALRPARFADETRPASILTVVSGEKGIESLRDSDGKDVPIARLEPLLIGSIFPIHGEDRIVVTPQEVPALLPQALTTVEDRKFYTHHGVDPVGIARAMWVNVRAGQMEQGGSTLTQQLVKSYFLDSRRTLGRKVREAIMAMSLDANFSKADLMNAYINEIFLGQDGDRAVHGFGLASQFYFGKPLSELDLSEVALLVAIVRGPTYYDPRRHADRARSRRDLVLKLMAERGIVKADDALAAEKKPLGVTSRATGGYYPAYLDFVRRTLRRDYHDQDLTEAGLRIYTSLEPRAQDQAELALERELARLDHQKKYPDAKLEGAVVVTSPQSGEVIAIVGSRNVGYDGFNRALDARRAMGSLVKPFIYLTALETGRYNAATIVQDAPVAIKLANGTVWRPENFTKQTYGPVPLVRALAESLNQATVGVGMDVGLSKVTETLKRFGIERPPAQVPSMLLGAIDITPMEVAQLYNGLANGGFRSSLRAVRAVISADSKPLKAFPLEVTPVASPDVVYEVDRMMEQVMEKGTGRGARAVLPPNLVVAGKSGTSSDYHDNWFAGFSGSHLAVVWVGYDDNLPTGFTGSSGALPVWARMMAGLGTTSWDAPMPESLAETWIDYGSGLRVDKECSDKDAVPIAVPVGIELPLKPECPGSKTPSIIERAGEWIRDLMR
ncbi:MAG TPA: penicillin-binding protein 1B [Steroidobacteraceae bacterium]|jgi:penicillin-binding protein 1B|nr:penicillin-binding protein 1B [Steroidobacteraceae bacterium]